MRPDSHARIDAAAFDTLDAIDRAAVFAGDAIASAGASISAACAVAGDALPISASLQTAFASALALVDGGEEGLLETLAGVLGASTEGVSVEIVPGDMDSVASALLVLQDAQEDGSPAAERVGALAEFYAWQCGLPEARRASPTRLMVVSLALAHVGTISARTASALDASLREGWERLDEVFEAAFGDRSRFDPEGVKRVDGKLPAWCGLFTLWAYRLAGLQVGTWKIGQGIASVEGIVRVPKSDVRVGDIGVIESASQHHYLVVRVRHDGTIVSVDGNTGGDGPRGAERGGAVAARASRTVAGTTAFYRAADLD